MSIEDDLRRIANEAQGPYTLAHIRRTQIRAADTIDELRTENEALRDRIRALNECGVETIAARNAEIEELRAALAPFAAIPDPGFMGDHVRVGPKRGARVSLGDVRRAAALMAPEGEG